MKRLFSLITIFLLSADLAFAACDSQTVLMLHANGTDASTTFTDSSASAHTVTAVGNAQIDTAQSVFGGASGLFDGSGDYLSVTDSTDFDLGAGDLTVDFRVRFTSQPDTALIDINNGRSNGLMILHAPSAGGLRAKIADSDFDFAWSPSNGVWYHIALIRTGTTLRAFINGTQIGTDKTNSTDISGTTGVEVGAEQDGTQPLNGWIDELRISKGIARWTENFTPETSEYCANRRVIVVS